VAQDYAEAVKWYRKAAEQGDDFGQNSLGSMYEDGEGVAQDYAEAVKWYRKAAEQGNAKAQIELGIMYAAGHGVAQNRAEAVKWWRKSANQGNASAQFNLGVSYGRGEGVPQNDLEAYIWSSLAAAQGVKAAAQNRDICASRMSREEIVEGQRRASGFVPRKEKTGLSPNNSASPDNPTVSGTGFFITDDGYLISNYHVVKDATKVRLLTSAGLIDAKVVQVDAANDLALLKADGRFACLPIAASRTGLLGGTVATVGFPDIGLQGFAPKLAKGEIASLSGAGDDPRYFQISVPVQPGNSGGALVDERGNVIGIVSAKLDAGAALAASGALPENVNYAVKSSLLLSFLESVPAVSAKLKAPNTKDEKFEDVVKSAQDAAVLVLVY
jgi:TPR repeat protein